MNAHQRRKARRGGKRAGLATMTWPEVRALTADLGIERHLDRGGRCECGACAARGQRSRRWRWLAGHVLRINPDAGKPVEFPF